MVMGSDINMERVKFRHLCYESWEMLYAKTTHHVRLIMKIILKKTLK